MDHSWTLGARRRSKPRPKSLFIAPCSITLRSIALGFMTLGFAATTLAACGSDAQQAAPSVEPAPAETDPIETDPIETESVEDPAPADEAAEDDGAPTEPDEAETANLAEPEATDLAYAEAPVRDEPAIDEAVCIALVPSDPAPDAVGVVTYRLVDEWVPWAYLALWVPNAQGESALTAGEPSVRNNDSFEFAIDESMLTATGWAIDTMTPDGTTLPCAIQTMQGTTAAGLAGNGSSGY